MRILFLLYFSIICIILFPATAYAVPPPDFLFNIGSQIVQAFSVAIIFLSAVFSVSYHFIKTRLACMKSKKILILTVSIIGIVTISIGSAYVYGNYKQQLEYEQWLEESQFYSQPQEEQDQYIKENISQENANKNIQEVEQKTTIDKLEIGATPEISKKGQEEDIPFITNIDNTVQDVHTTFIEKYYEEIANHKFEEAYNISKKSVGFETFKSWYINTRKITLDKLVRIDDRTSSLELTLYENNTYTRYGVVMALKMQNTIPIQIASSSVRILSQGSFVEKGDEIIAKEDERKTSFYTQNKNHSLSISNAVFQESITSNRENYIVLDARENLEYENGSFSGSIHIRFADLQAGKWIEIPENKFVYVLCWSGIRGKEVAEFLRTKNIVASYLENGANGWVEWGGKWEGNIKFSEQYVEERYKKIFTTDEVKNETSKGVILVDCREPWKFKKQHISNSFKIPIMYTPTKNLEEVFAQVPENSTIITICDGYINCFDAKITAVELEARGHRFIGRYNKPWEYE